MIAFLAKRSREWNSVGHLLVLLDSKKYVSSSLGSVTGFGFLGPHAVAVVVVGVRGVDSQSPSGALVAFLHRPFTRNRTKSANLLAD